MILDIILVLVLVGFVIFGVYKGFLSSVLSICNFFVSFVLASLMAAPVAKILIKIKPLSRGITEFISNKLIEASYYMAEPLAEATTASAALNNATGLGGFLKFLLKIFAGNGIIMKDATPAQYFSAYLGNFCITLIALLFVFIIIRVLIGILSKIIIKITSNKVVGAVNKILGGVFGAIKGFILTAVVFLTISFITMIPFVGKTVEAKINETTIVKAYSEQTVKITKSFLSSIDLKRIINNIANNKYELK